MRKVSLVKLLMAVMVICMTISALTACNGNETLTARFIVDNGIYQSVEIADGQTEISLPKDPTKTGYVFDGWYLDNGTYAKAFTGDVSGTESTVNILIYAKWKVCEHDLSDWAQTVAPTCEACGEEAQTCAICGLKNTREIAALGHTVVIDEAVEATCETNGLTEGSHCSTCNKVLVRQKTIKAHGHTEVTLEKVAPTCETDGLTQGKYCSVCDKVLVAQKTVKAYGHKAVTDAGKEATCTEDGLTEGSHCSRCDKVLVAQTVISALGHTPTIDKKVDATCTATGLTEGKHCSVCGEVLVAQTVIAAKGHDYGDWQQSKAPTCEVKGQDIRYCANDSTHYETREVAALGHDWDDGKVAKNPTCTQKGVMTYTCERTGCTATRMEDIAANGHDLVEVPAKLPTATEDGYAAYEYCKNCDYTTKVDISSGHTNWQKYPAKAATCTENGWKEYWICMDPGCGYSTFNQYTVIAALGHNYTLDTTKGTNGYSWNATHTECTAYGVCVRTGCTAETKEHTVTVKATIESKVTQNATCVLPQKTTYTATFDVKWATTQTVMVQTDTALGHTYGAATYAWNDGHTVCTATRTCTREGCTAETTGHTQTATATVTSNVTQNQSCQNPELTTYTATFGVDWATKQTEKNVQTKAALGHDYKLNATKGENGYDRGDGRYYAYLVCQREGCEDTVEQTLTLYTLNVTFYSSKAATCTTAGFEVYKLTFDKWNEEENGITATAVNKWIDSVGGTVIVKFTVGAKGHNYGDLVAKQDANCTEKGHKAYYYCEDCKTYFDENKVSTTLADLEIGAKGHNSDGSVAHVDADCINTGVVGGTYCTRCEYNKAAAEATIDALGHNSEGSVAHKEADCINAGVVGGTYCTRCNEGKAAAEATIDALGHNSEGSVAHKDPDCINTGVVGGTYCTRCEYNKAAAEATIGALGHNSEGTIAHKDPDCINTGVVGGTYCTRCNNGKAAAEATIDALGHNSDGTIAHKEADCTNDGVVGGTYCTRCNEGKEAAEATIDALGHNSDGSVAHKDPDCINTGVVGGTYCTRCNEGKEAAEATIDALGHNSDGSVAHKDPDCTNDGVVGGTYCTRCEYNKAAAEATIDALGHNSEGSVAHKEAGCINTGVVGGTYCTRCNEGKAAAEATIDALGHNSEGSVAHKDPDCINTGVVGGTYCTRCNEGKAAAEVVIPATGHKPATTWSYDEDGHYHKCQNGCDERLGNEAHVWEDGVCKTCECKNVYGTAGLTIIYSNGYYVSAYNGTATEIVIPAYYDDGTNGLQKVTAIGYEAFKDQTAITKVVIPDTVTTIGGSAFYGCTALADITFPDTIISIGQDALCVKADSQGTNNTAWYKAQPNGEVYIGKVLYAYKGAMSENYTLEIKEGTVSVSAEAFDAQYTTGETYRPNLKAVTMPDSLKVIGARAFRYCTSLSEITLGTNVTAIGNEAFQYCYGASKITLNDNLQTIGSNAFYGCKKLTQLTIPASVTAIGECAFSMCDKLTMVTFEGDDTTSKLLSLGELVFDSNETLKYIYFDITHKKLKEVCADKKCSFYGSSKVIVYTKTSQFRSYYDATTAPPCAGGSYAYWFDFRNNKCYKDAYFDTEFDPLAGAPHTTKEGEYTYDDAVSTTQHYQICTVCSGKLNYTDHSYDSETHLCECGKADPSLNTQGTEGLVYSYDETAKTYTVSGYTGTATAVTIPAWYNDDTNGLHQVTAIGEDAFRNKSIASVTIPNTVKAIGANAFMWDPNQKDDDNNPMYSSLASVTFEDGSTLTTIGGNTFYGCSALTSIAIPDSVTEIDGQTFCNCTALERIIIPAGVTQIYGYTFNGCTALESVTFKGTVTTIMAGAFYGCSALTSIDLTNVTEIRRDAFYGCLALKEVTFKEGVTIGNTAFQVNSSYTSNLQKITFNGAATIGKNTFQNVGDRLTEIVINASGDSDNLAALTTLLDGIGNVGFKTASIGNLTVTFNNATAQQVTAATKAQTATTAWYRSFINGNNYQNFKITCSDGDLVVYHDAVKPTDCQHTGTRAYIEDIKADKYYSYREGNFEEYENKNVSVTGAHKYVCNTSKYTGTYYEDLNGNRYVYTKVGDRECYRVYVKCSLCGEDCGYFSSEKHELAATSATCTEDGKESLTLTFAKCAVENNPFFGAGFDNDSTNEWIDSYTIKVNGEYIVTVSRITEAKLGHSYVLDTTKGTDGYTWATDYSSCVAHGKCEREGCTHTIDVPATVTPSLKQEQSCVNAEIYDYTATFDVAWATTQKVENVQAKGALGHAYGDLVVKQDAKCTEKGHEAYYYCEACKTYFDEHKVSTTWDKLEISAKGHDLTKTDAKDATCTEEGNIEYWTCGNDDCGKIFSDQAGTTEIELKDTVITKKGHEYTEEVVTNDYLKSAATCTSPAVYYKSCACGASSKGTDGEATFTYGEKGEHSYDSGSGKCACGAYDERGTEGLTFTTSTISSTDYYFVSGYSGTEKDIVIPAFHTENETTLAVMGIAQDAFNGKDAIETVKITTYGDTLAKWKICQAAFYGCTSLKTIDFGGKLRWIEQNAFYGCTNLEQFTFPNTLVSIGTMAFQGCDKFTEVKFEEGSQMSGSGTYGFYFNGNTAVKTIDLSNCTKMTEITRVSSCTALETVILPDSLTKIGDQAFYGCTSLQTISLPSKVEYIGWQAFYNCNKLTSITIPASVTGMDETNGKNFYGSGLTSITFNTTKDGASFLFTNNAISKILNGANNLTTVEFSALTIEDLKNITESDVTVWYASLLNDTNKASFTIKCSDDSITVYKAASAAPANCQEQGNYEYYYDYKADKYYSDIAFTTELTEVSYYGAHSYGDLVTYAWNTSYTECTATRTCSVCAEGTEGHTQTATATGDQITFKTVSDSSCTTPEITEFTATFTETWAATQTKEVVITAATGHSGTDVCVECGCLLETISIADYASANGWNNKDVKTEVKANCGVIINASGGSSSSTSGYTSTSDWRIYKNTGKLTFTAKDCTLVSVKIVYSKDGVLNANEKQYKSGDTIAVSGTSLEISVTSDQVRITSIQIAYKVTDQQKVNKIADGFTAPTYDTISVANYTLPSSVEGSNATISWESFNSAIVIDTDGKLTITQGAEETEGTLKATFTLTDGEGNVVYDSEGKAVTATKDYPITVPEKGSYKVTVTATNATVQVWDEDKSEYVDIVDGAFNTTGGFKIKVTVANDYAIDSVTLGGTSLTASEEEGVYTGTVTADTTLTVTGKRTKGSEDNPYSVAEALAVIDTLGDATSDKVYVVGYIKDTPTYNSSYKSYTFNIVDVTSDTTALKIYGAKLADGVMIYQNDKVLVSGYLMAYIEKDNTTTPELTYSGSNNAYVEAVKERGTSTITYTVDDSTHATVKGDTSCTNGDELSFTVTATEGFKVASVTANGTTVTAGEDGSYTVTVKGNMTIEITTADKDAVVETTVTVNIPEYASTNSWGSNKQNKELLADDVVKITVDGSQNTGKYYSDWRLYQADEGTVTVTAKEGYTIVSVKFTYTNNNSGVLLNGETQVNSDDKVNVNAQNITLSVGNTNAKTNGQVKVTAIEVVYKANSSSGEGDEGGSTEKTYSISVEKNDNVDVLFEQGGAYSQPQLNDFIKNETNEGIIKFGVKPAEGYKIKTVKVGEKDATVDASITSPDENGYYYYTYTIADDDDTTLTVTVEVEVDSTSGGDGSGESGTTENKPSSMSYTFSSPLLFDGTTTTEYDGLLDNIQWNIKLDSNCYTANNSGFQIGSNNKPLKTVTLTTTGLANFKTIKLNLKNAGKKASLSVSVTVGGQSATCNGATSVTTTTTATDYTFDVPEGVTDYTIVITITNSATQSGVVIGSIVVE